MIEATAAELRALAAAAGDATGHFPAMYARVTERIAGAIDGGQFRDGPRMAAFAAAFAARYTGARGGHGGPPRCWQATWDVGGDRRLLVVQHLLLGINAHVNHDLPLVVVELADRTGDLASIRPDFDAVNDVLAATSQEVLDELDRVARWVSHAARLGGDRAFNFSLRVARRQAWEAAERLHRLDPEGRARDVRELDRLVTVLAYGITRPPFPASAVLPVLRLLERRDPRAVTASLLGSAR